MNLKRTAVNESLHRLRKKPRPGELTVGREEIYEYRNYSCRSLCVNVIETLSTLEFRV